MHIYIHTRRVVRLDWGKGSGETISSASGWYAGMYVFVYVCMCVCIYIYA